MVQVDYPVVKEQTFPSAFDNVEQKVWLIKSDGAVP